MLSSIMQWQYSVCDLKALSAECHYVEYPYFMYCGTQNGLIKSYYMSYPYK